MSTSPNPFRFKVSATMQGQEKLLKALYDRASPQATRELNEWMARRLLAEAKRLVPRETGELESEIQVFYEGSTPVAVGVSGASPAAEKARATEYGSWNYTAGEPGSPKLDWPVKSKPTAAMPWLRTAALVHRFSFLKKIRRYFVTGRREKD